MVKVHIDVCMFVHVCIRSTLSLSPEVKQSPKPLQCTKESCSSDTCIKLAPSTSPWKGFLCLKKEASRGKIRFTKGHHGVSPAWRDQGSTSDSPAKPTSKTPSCYWATFFFFSLNPSVARHTFPWGRSSACKKPVISSKPQTLENMGCAISGLLFKEASVLSIWQLFIIAVALRNNNSHDNCFSYIKMLQSLFPTTFCLSGMCVPMSPQSSQTVVYVLSLLRVNRHDLSGKESGGSGLLI